MHASICRHMLFDYINYNNLGGSSLKVVRPHLDGHMHWLASIFAMQKNGQALKSGQAIARAAWAVPPGMYIDMLMVYFCNAQVC